MARPTSRVFPLLAIAFLVTALGLAFFATPILAQEDGEGAAANETEDNETAGNGTDENATGGAAAGDLAEVDWAFTVREESCTEGCAFDHTLFTVPGGSRVYLIYDSTEATAQHNARPTEGAEDPQGVLQDGIPISADSGQSSWVFTMPESGEVTFVCDVHPEMTGTFQAGEFSAGAGGGADIVEAGVHFLAHWVGVIAFAALFIMYGLTFFLFKYNETGFTTDHKDRAVPAGAGVDVYGQDVRVSKGTAVTLAILLTVLSIALVWAFVNGLIM